MNEANVEGEREREGSEGARRGETSSSSRCFDGVVEWQLRAKGDRYSKILLPFRIHTANLGRPGPCLREEEDSLLEEKDFEKKGEEKLELIEDARVFPVVAPSSHSYHCLSLESVGIDRGILSSFLFWKNLSSGIPFPRVSRVILARVGEQRKRGRV